MLQPEVVSGMPPALSLDNKKQKVTQAESPVDISNQIWEDLSPWAWRNSIYTPEAADNCMGKLFQSEIGLFETLTFPAGPEKTTIIEVGCGTAELFGVLAKKASFQKLIGLEISHNMVKCAYEIHPHLKEAAANTIVFQGNAVDLNAAIKAEGIVVSPNPIVCILMNTYGILPEHVRALTLRQMWESISDGGTLVLGCWNKDEMRVGCRTYYMQNPDLCGKCSEDDFDFEKGFFDNKRTGYTSQWWTEANMHKDLESAAPFKVTIKFVKHGVGIFALGKKA